MSDEYDDLFDPEDEEKLLAAWAEVDREANRLLGVLCREVLDAQPPEAELDDAVDALRAGIAQGRWPYDYFVNACGWDVPPEDSNVEVWLEAAAATVSPVNDPGADAEEQATVMALQHADWLGMAAAAVRGGVGSALDADAVLAEIDAIPDIEGESEDPEADRDALDTAIEILAPLWEALGIVDDDRCWTELGRWGLPVALSLVWGGEADDKYLADEDTTAALSILLDGPKTLEELRRELAKRSIFADEQRIALSLYRREESYEFDDGSFGHFPTLAEGVVLTHRVTEEELALGQLADGVDLCLFGFLSDEGAPLASGGEVRLRYRAHGEPVPSEAGAGLVGPEGWLVGFEPGTLIAMRYAGGVLALEPVAAAAESDPRLVDLARTRATAAAQGESVDGHPAASALDIVLTLRSRDLLALTAPSIPLSEQLTSAGLEVMGGDVGIQGTAWYGEPEWLSAEQRTAYRAWRSALSRQESTPDELGLLLGSLEGFVLDLAAHDAGEHPHAEALVEALLVAATGAERAAPLYLLSRIAEAKGDGLAWLSYLEAAVGADPAQREALGDLADLKSVLGDAREAHRLYGLAGVDTGTPEVAVLRRFLQIPEGETGRNKPCPCGSGKKYKVCHGRTAQHPLGDRAQWLWVKAVTFLNRGVNRSELLFWASQRTGLGEEDRQTIAHAMGDDVTHDFALFDGGLFTAFLETLGPLLPDDERALALEWAETPRRLLEVGSVVPMRGVMATDLVTGQTLEITDRAMTTAVRPKDLILGRALPDGEGALRFRGDPLSIPRLMRPRLLALLREGAGPEAVLEFLSPHGQQPQLQTTDGHDLVLCTARYDVPSLDDAWAALSRRLEPREGDELVALASGPRGEVVQGRLLRQGDRIAVETMSVERLRDLQGLLLELVPEARLVDESTRPFEDLLAEEPLGPPTPQAELPADVIEQIVRDHEQRWLADSIPALGGLTPREAAVDFAMRPELEALLDDLEWSSREHGGNAMTMDAGRLREELGL